ncbi:hypothetical protein [Pontiella agarivorans]|uniref:Uncharacterized protein n=1 Tax=Pontiella agarivorans TaxID=3038953 RepID=A0ABU5MZY9_9BACT|nr:hypothetical protein [Pontiella agarivorans]MDZ8119531.1 hypothetical protein [Pontiella agarivorans]
MTLRENLKQQIEPFITQEESAVRLVKVSGIVIVIGYPVYLIWHIIGALLFIPLACFGIGVMKKNMTVASAGTKVKCPVCNKRLGFIFRDVNNFSWSPFSRIQKEDSGEITHCPSCLTGMDEEIESQNQWVEPTVADAN